MFLFCWFHMHLSLCVASINTLRERGKEGQEKRKGDMPRERSKPEVEPGLAVVRRTSNNVAVRVYTYCDFDRNTGNFGEKRTRDGMATRWDGTG